MSHARRFRRVGSTPLSPTFFFTVYSLGLRPVERLDPSPPLDFSDGVSGGVGIQIASRASPRARMCPREHHPRSIRVSPRTQRGATQIPQAEPPTHQLTTVERGPARHVTPLVSPHWLSVRKRHSHLKTRPRRKPKPPFAHQTLTVSSHPALPPPHHTGSIQGGPQGAPPRRQGGQGQGQGGRGCQEIDSQKNRQKRTRSRTRRLGRSPVQ